MTIKLPEAIIVDIDGTLAHMVPGPDGTTRSPYDFNRVYEDQVDHVIKRLVALEWYHGSTIIICSGREEDCRDVTEQWLADKGIEHHHLFMRASGDRRKDAVVKREIYEASIKGKFNVHYVLDDRNQVVELWRSLGLRCLQVAEGDF